MPPDLLIAGASARAATFSAVRAGFRVAAADLFADRDLLTVAEATAVSDWPAGLERWAHLFPRSIPLVYVGGLENEPELLERIAAARPVLGVRGETLRRVRTPELLSSRFDRWRIPRPASIGDGTEIDGPRRWLIKPRRSAAGRGIRWRTVTDAAPDEHESLQEFIEGRVGSAAFLARDDGVVLLGTTEMLLPDVSFSSVLSPFAYCGSITADAIDPEPLDRIGRCLAEAGLRGLFGVDYVRRESADGVDYVPIEVNPRYTAGMEVLELRDGRSFVAEHVAAYSAGERRSEQEPRLASGACIGKRIVYAPRPCRAGAIPSPTAAEIVEPASLFPFADIPEPGTPFQAGAPICTVFATGIDRGDCDRRLRELERDVVACCEPV